MTDEIRPGLSALPQSEWPQEPKENVRPIDLLAEKSVHDRILSYLRDRIKLSEDQMQKFYSRWNWNEKRIQAYVTLPDYEQALKDMNNSGEPPKITSIILPYMFATQSTIVTYLIQALCGRKPIFQLSANDPKKTDAARTLEGLLQYNAEHERMIKKLFQFFHDGELYGVQILQTAWKQDKQKRTVIKQAQDQGSSWLSLDTKPSWIRVREERTVFEGTELRNIDPFMFFPDPRVPMAEVNRKGEFVFWRTFEGKHVLKKEESAGRLKYIDNIPAVSTSAWAGQTQQQSQRSLVAGGESTPGDVRTQITNGTQYYTINQGTVWIIPAELGLGTSTKVELWIFSIANNAQIIQAEPLDLDHGMHPVVVGEPYSMGYGFGQLSAADYLSGVQDSISWFVNSHIHNVRAALNNMFVVDPSMIEMQDLRNPAPGKFIRLKRTAYGRDVRQAVTQLNVQDITRGHISDMEMFLRIGDMMAAVNDNLRGLQDAGGRKSATEARTSAEAAASRLAAHAKLISAQSLVDLAEQMSLNYQQFLSTEFSISVLGETESILVTPESIVGDFTFPINDGTLPLDKVALMDVWKEVMMGAAQDPELRQTYSIPKMFAYVAELGGAKNLDAMRLSSEEVLMQQAQAGNIVPTSALPQPGQTEGLQGASPANRFMGALG